MGEENEEKITNKQTNKHAKKTNIIKKQNVISIFVLSTIIKNKKERKRKERKQKFFNFVTIEI